MDIKYITTLKAILETGSFQKAAFRLNYTQSTVTFHIQQLEQEFSYKLFEKIGRKMVFTQAGHDILPHIDSILRELQWIQNYGKDMSEMKGTIRIGMPDALLCYGMQPVLTAFRKQAPCVELIIPSLNCYDIHEGIINGVIDIGVHCKMGSYPQTIEEEALTSYYAILVASSHADPDQLDFITPHQRKSINLINTDPNSLHQKRLMKYLEEKDIILNSNIEMWSTDATKISVISDLGIAYLPDYVVEKELKNHTP